MNLPVRLAADFTWGVGAEMIGKKNKAKSSEGVVSLKRSAAEATIAYLSDNLGGKAVVRNARRMCFLARQIVPALGGLKMSADAWVGGCGRRHRAGRWD